MTIDSFSGDYFFLSNFYPAENYWLGMYFPTVEHAFQSAKQLDLGHMLAVRHCATPAEAKRLGGKCILRGDWERVKDSIMSVLVYRKFDSSKTLRKLLLDTGDVELIEGNTWGDTYWGVCNGVGQNRLGKILMSVRSRLREEEK